MKKTIAETIKDEMTGQGYTLVGKTSGWNTARKGSNLQKLLAALGLGRDEVTVRQGAKKQRQTEGTDLFVFKK